MLKNKTYNRKKVLVVFTGVFLLLVGLLGRLCYLMVFQSEYYQAQAEDLHEREREIKAARGKIIDAKGEVLAANQSVCTVSVIHSQIKEPEEVIWMLARELEMDEETVRTRVEKNSSIEKIKSNVDKEAGDIIRSYELSGVKVDEDYKRYYPYATMASKVLGFTGSDNQGIIGLEVKYEEYLKGTNGTILTLTDARGVEISGAGEERVEPVAGNDLYISLDSTIQSYAEQAALNVLEAKQADSVSILIMNPKNGEIMAMVNAPEFDLNDPYSLNLDIDTESLTDEEYQEQLNQMWRNPSISDTYEPGSTFKVMTAAAALEQGVVSLEETFNCPGYRIVEDRRIKCHKTTGHGTQTFTEAVMNSCNPVFIEMGARLGVDGFYSFFEQFGLLSLTGIDLPGEAGTIMHNPADMGQVELATVAFGQSFQLTPLQLTTTVSSIINGGTRVTPHLGLEVRNEGGEVIESFSYEEQTGIVSAETAETMQYLLEQVVYKGSGNRAYLAGYQVGGKTGTSETLPRSLNKYIASFIGFAPADDPEVIALVIVNNPQGIYYGSTVSAPIVASIFDNILPYLGVEQHYTQEELENFDVEETTMPDLIGRSREEIDEIVMQEGLTVSYIGEEGTATDQFPLPGEQISKSNTVIVYLE